MKRGLAIAAQEAPLPMRYEAACHALAECERLDECHEWANRAQAAASYYRQSKDVAMEEAARRIRLRAKRRCGEILLLIKGPAPRNARGRPKKGSQTPRTAAARAVGLSKVETRNVVRLARIPAPVAEAQIEASPPATEAAMLRIAPTDPKFNGNTFCGGPAYTKLVREQNGLAMFSYWCQKNPGGSFALNAEERSRCLKHVAEIRRWIADFTNAKTGNQ
jgi:hypothetical protein